MNDAVKIYHAPIAATARAGRREAEREAVARLLKDTLGDGIVMAHDDNGRPYLPARPDTYISVSHCAGECVLAVSPQPVGVDVETPRRQLERIAPKFLTPAETARGPHDMAALLRYWTAKEAVFKCAGIPDLVISEVEVTARAGSDVTGGAPVIATASAGIAVARGRRFAITWHPAPDGLLAIAIEDK